MHSAHRIARVPLEQVAALTCAPNRRSEAQLCGVFPPLLAIFGEARDICRQLGSFRHFLMGISTTGVYEKNKPFRFLTNDGKDAAIERYGRSEHMVILVACRIHEDEDSYPEVTVTSSVIDSAGSFLSTCSEEDP